MEHQFRGLAMKAVFVTLLLAAFTTLSTQQGNSTTTATTTNPSSTTTDNSTTTSTTTSKTDAGVTSPSAATIATTNVTTAVTTAATIAATTKPTTVAPPVGKLRPVSDTCLKQYLNCTDKTPEYLAANFCQAFNVKKACINDTLYCNATEVSRIAYVDCGPNFFATDKTIATKCQGRITECLSLSDKPENINPATEFKTFFCTKKDEKCMTTASATAKCTADEYKAAVKMAGCTAAQTVISSALFISLAILTQRIFYRY